MYDNIFLYAWFILLLAHRYLIFGWYDKIALRVSCEIPHECDRYKHEKNNGADP